MEEPKLEIEERKGPETIEILRPPETVEVLLQGIVRAEWELFEFLCKNKEGISPGDKLLEMIRSYNRKRA